MIGPGSPLWTISDSIRTDEGFEFRCVAASLRMIAPPVVVFSMIAAYADRTLVPLLLFAVVPWSLVTRHIEFLYSGPSVRLSWRILGHRIRRSTFLLGGGDGASTELVDATPFKLQWPRLYRLSLWLGTISQSLTLARSDDRDNLHRTAEQMNVCIEHVRNATAHRTEA